MENLSVRHSRLVNAYDKTSKRKPARRFKKLAAPVGNELRSAASVEQRKDIGQCIHILRAVFANRQLRLHVQDVEQGIARQ